MISCFVLKVLLVGNPGEGESGLDDEEDEEESSEAAGEASEEDDDVDMAGTEISDDIDDDQGPPGPPGRGGSTTRGGTKHTAEAAGISGGEASSPPGAGMITEAVCCRNPIVLGASLIVTHAHATREQCGFVRLHCDGCFVSHLCLLALCILLSRSLVLKSASSCMPVLLFFCEKLFM